MKKTASTKFRHVVNSTAFSLFTMSLKRQLITRLVRPGCPLFYLKQMRIKIIAELIQCPQPDYVCVSLANHIVQAFPHFPQ